MSIKHMLIVIFLIPAIHLTACSTKKMATNVIGKISTDGMTALECEEDVAFARESALPLLKTLEVLRHGNTKDRVTLVLLSKAYAEFVFGFLEDDMLRYRKDSKEYKEARRRADLFYRRGKEYGIAALIESRAMHRAFKSPFQQFNKALSKLGKKYAPALFWTAFNWAGWLNLNADDPTAIINLPRIEAMVRRVIELDSNFYYGSAHALLATLASSRPKMLGGDPELANREFHVAMNIAPDYLMTKVLFAQYYARQVQDEDLFQSSLDEVLAADVTNFPQQRLVNELAKRRAELLLGMKKKFF